MSSIFHTALFLCSLNNIVHKVIYVEALFLVIELHLLTLDVLFNVRPMSANVLDMFTVV